MKDRLMAFALGLFIAYEALPGVMHLIYLAAVFLAFGAGYWVAN